MSKSILVDSNVLVYAINSSSPKHRMAQAFLRDHTGHLVLTHQNLLETFRVLTHKKFQDPMTPSSAAKSIDAIADACRVIPPAHETYHVAAAFIQKHKLAGDKVFDAYLAAIALSAGIDAIATDNVRDFRDFEGLAVINPFA